MVKQSVNTPRWIFIGALLTGLTSYHVPAKADIGTNENPFDLSMEELLSVEVSVASRSLLTLSQTPSSVSVYHADEFNSMGITDLDQLLNFIPGFKTSREDQARLNAITVRGRRINQYSPDILVLLDGIRLNDPVTGGGLANVSQLSLANVKQVEVIRGPGSALYGSNAFSGVINIITHVSTNQVSLSIGANDLQAQQITFTQSVDQWQLSGFIGKQQDKGQYYPPLIDYLGLYEPMSDPQHSEDLQLKLRYQDLTISTGWTERVYQQFIQGSIPSDQNQLDRSNRYIQLKYQHQWSEGITLDLIAQDTRATQDERLLFYPAHIAAQLPFGWTDGSKVDLLGGNRREAGDRRLGFDGRWTHNPHHQLQFGYLWQQEYTGANNFQGNYDAAHQQQTNGMEIIPSTTGIQQGYWLPGGTRLDLLKPYKRQINGVYIQSQWQLSSKTSLTSGLRHDHYQDVGSNLSLRGGLVYNHSPESDFKLLYGEAFRAPSIFDSRAEFSSAVVGNPQLKPELIKNIDLIWQQKWDNSQLTTNLFYSIITDEVVVQMQEPIPGFTSLQPVNQGTQQLTGIELELQTNINDHSYLKAGLSWFGHQQTLGTSKALAFVSLNTHFGHWHWNINGYYHDQVLSRETAEQNIYLGSYLHLSSKLAYRINDNIDIAFTITNLLDKSYRTYTTSLGLEHGLPERGRQWRLDFDWFFN